MLASPTIPAICGSRAASRDDPERLLVDRRIGMPVCLGWRGEFGHHQFLLYGCWTVVKNMLICRELCFDRRATRLLDNTMLASTHCHCLSLPQSPSGCPSAHFAAESERRAHRQFVVPVDSHWRRRARRRCSSSREGDKVRVSRRSRRSLRFRRRTCCRRRRGVPGSQCAPLARVEAPARRAFRPRAVRTDDADHRPPGSPRQRPRRAARPDEESACRCPATSACGTVRGTNNRAS